MMQRADEQRADTQASLVDERWALPWREIVGSTVRHLRMVLSLVVAGAVVMGVSAFLQSPVYEARSALRLVANRADVKVSPEDRSPAQVERIDDNLVNTEVSWLRSEGVLREVLAPWRAKFEANQPPRPSRIVSRLVQLPFELPGMVYRRLHGAPEPSAFEAWVQRVRNRLVVSSERLSTMISMSFTDSTPEFAAEVLNSLIAYRMKGQTQLSRQDEALGFFEEQSQLLAERVRHAEEALRAFYEREGIVGGPEERQKLRDRLAEIHTLLAQSDTELAETRVRVDFLQKAMRRLPRRVEVPGTGASMQSRVVELMLERSKLLASYAPTSVKVADLDHQIAEAKRLLREEGKFIAEASAATNPTYAEVEKDLIQRQAQQVALEARIAALSEQEREYREQIRKSVGITSTLEQLETDLERAKVAHRTYIEKREAARFSIALDASQILNITVTEPATVPTTPVPVRTGADALLGAIAGLVAGIGLAYVRDLIDPTVKSVTEVSRLTGMRVLGEVSS